MRLILLSFDILQSLSADKLSRPRFEVWHGAGVHNRSVLAFEGSESVEQLTSQRVFYFAADIGQLPRAGFDFIAADEMHAERRDDRRADLASGKFKGNAREALDHWAAPADPTQAAAVCGAGATGVSLCRLGERELFGDDLSRIRSAFSTSGTKSLRPRRFQVGAGCG